VRQLGKEVQGISPDAVKLLIEYPWPGNVREMQSVVRRALLQTTGAVLMADALPPEIRAGSRQPSGASAANAMFDRLIEDRMQTGTHDLYAEVLAATETCLLTRVLELTRGNQSQAARILGITRGSLRHKLLTLNIHCEGAIFTDENEVDGAVVAAS
jgi:two-component system nitrogen regulation response regulator GlnG